MIKKFRTFLKYVQDYGLSNAFLYALYVITPKAFLLLHKKIYAITSVVWPGMAEVDHTTSLNSVFDYGTWSDFGGSIKPMKSADIRETFIWFVPDWINVWGGGHYTLFRFANYFAKSNTRNVIYIYNNERHQSPLQLQNDLDKALINCKLEVIIDPKLLPVASGAIATTWQSAYHVRAFNFARKKFYFMQDYESQFYPYGTASMQANATYTFGFIGITGGGWLKKCYEAHGGIAKNYLFSADKNIFYPANKNAEVRSQIKKIFFYGRPSTERRCFELGMAALKKIADNFPDVEIVIAGLDLKAQPPFKATLLGNMSLVATGELYRTCDIGIAFSATNLSYLPIELMASGVPVISNNGPQVEWHCKHGINSYLVDPTPTAIFDAFSFLFNHYEVRQKLVDGGLSTMAPLSWESEMAKIYEYVNTSLSETL